MYTNSTFKPIYQGQAYTGLDGTEYGRNFPLNEISELTLVTETAQPTDSTLMILGFTIDNTYTQVWSTRPKTSGELIVDSNNSILAQIHTLEATQTSRRIRDALVDSTWLKNLEVQIAALRAKLTQ